MAARRPIGDSAVQSLPLGVSDRPATQVAQGQEKSSDSTRPPPPTTVTFVILIDASPMSSSPLELLIARNKASDSLVNGSAEAAETLTVQRGLDEHERAPLRVM